MSASVENGFDVALSYAGEDRAFVQRVAEHLKQNRLNVFFDKFEEVELWGKDLVETLEGIYRLRSKYVVIFISEAYARKVWTRHEVRSALSRAVQEKQEFVLPARFDDTELPGLLPSVAFIDLRGETPESFASKVARKVMLGLPLKEIKPQPPPETGNRPEPAAPKPSVVDDLRILTPKRSILVANAQYNFLPRGTFPMGSDDGYPAERPRHPVAVSSFFMAVQPVTNLDFDSFVRETGHVTTAETGGLGYCLLDGVWQLARGADWRHPAGPNSHIVDKMDHPVVQVSWHDAGEYCRWLSSITNFHFDLPTEARREYAAAGPNGHVWAFGDSFRRGAANVEGHGTTPVASFAPNHFGLYDMTGNVYEWCADWFTESWAEAGHRLDGGMTVDPAGPPKGHLKALRGGSWFDSARDSRCANRYFGEPSLGAANIGFRPSLRLTDELLIRLLSERRWGLNAEQML